jgi:hypothetical protein
MRAAVSLVAPTRQAFTVALAVAAQALSGAATAGPATRPPWRATPGVRRPRRRPHPPAAARGVPTRPGRGGGVPRGRSAVAGRGRHRRRGLGTRARAVRSPHRPGRRGTRNAPPGGDRRHQAKTDRINAGCHSKMSCADPPTTAPVRRGRPRRSDEPVMPHASGTCQSGLKASRSCRESGRWSMPPNSGTTIDLMRLRRSGRIWG